jgi:hypothetical protein
VQISFVPFVLVILSQHLPLDICAENNKFGKKLHNRKCCRLDQIRAGPMLTWKSSIEVRLSPLIPASFIFARTASTSSGENRLNM